MSFNKADKEKIKELALKYNLPVSVVEGIVNSPYDFIKAQSKKIHFKDNMSREDFDLMKKNFNIPSIGKLYASHYRYDQIQKKKIKKK